jgi:SHS2 domain-containing protein
MHEVFEHTADLGLRIRCGTLPELYSEAGAALFELIVENFADVRPSQVESIRLKHEQPDLLLFDWLNELLFLFDTKHMVFCRFEVRYDAGELEAQVWGEPLDADRHHLDHEVKAITYHRLRVEKQQDGAWLAEVIVDI